MLVMFILWNIFIAKSTNENTCWRRGGACSSVHSKRKQEDLNLWASFLVFGTGKRTLRFGLTHKSHCRSSGERSLLPFRRIGNWIVWPSPRHDELAKPPSRVFSQVLFSVSILKLPTTNLFVYCLWNKLHSFRFQFDSFWARLVCFNVRARVVKPKQS